MTEAQPPKLATNGKKPASPMFDDDEMTVAQPSMKLPQAQSAAMSFLDPEEEPTLRSMDEAELSAAHDVAPATTERGLISCETVEEETRVGPSLKDDDEEEPTRVAEKQERIFDEETGPTKLAEQHMLPLGENDSD